MLAQVSHDAQLLAALLALLATVVGAGAWIVRTLVGNLVETTREQTAHLRTIAEHEATEEALLEQILAAVQRRGR